MDGLIAAAGHDWRNNASVRHTIQQVFLSAMLTDLHLSLITVPRGETRGDKGDQCPWSQITGGFEKSQQCCKYFLQCSTLPPKMLGSNMGAQNVFLALGDIWPRSVHARTQYETAADGSSSWSKTCKVNCKSLSCLERVSARAPPLQACPPSQEPLL